MAGCTPLIAALVLLWTIDSTGAARPQLAFHASNAALKPEAGEATGSSTVELCGQSSDEVCSLPGLNGAPHVRMRAGYLTVSQVSDRQLWYLVADRQEDRRQQQQQQQDPEVGDSAAGDDDGNAAGASGGSGSTSTSSDGGDDSDGESSLGRRLERHGGSDSGASPVILWLTGGPGCSSLDAFIYEHGPFKFSYASSTTEGQSAEAGAGVEGEQRRLQQQRTVVLEENPYAWTKVATVIYVDSPAGVGMSYSGRPDIDYHTNDEYTIADLLVFLEGLTERYPELATAPFFLAGESYGGVFVPLLARELLRVNRERREAGDAPLVNVQGYMVGNPVTDDVVDGNAQNIFAADMGYVDPPTWRYMRAACDDMFWNATRDSECWTAQAAIKDDLWDLNWYDVLDPCINTNDPSQNAPGGLSIAAATAQAEASGSGSSAGGQRRRRRRPAAELERRFYWPFTARLGAPPPLEQEGVQQQQHLETGRRGGQPLWGPWLRHAVPCMDRRIALEWLNREEVRAALHARPASAIGGWQPCSDELYYRLDTMELVPVHEELVRKGLRALVYSGDHDMVVPHTGTRKWVYDKASLGAVDGPLRPWMLDGQVAGFTARFSAGAGLRFATVKGAGHMVPQSKPLQALHLLRTFLYDGEL